MQGKDKGLIPALGQPMIEHILARVVPQTNQIIINCNRNAQAYQQYGYPVYSDTISGYLGPLAGILSALIHCQTPYLLTLPCDSPNITENYLSRMTAKLTPDAPCVAEVDTWLQPTFSALHKNFIPKMQDYLDQGERAAGKWFRQHQCIPIDFSDCPEGFMNINQPDELAAWENTRHERD